ncbi:sugar diacid recognition domain-containing protein, partial [Burkholderia thailandensis]|uniref:sugar diacid recognition domain-containing protein n=1 Tax=Burkholderia thailandensis TaxID=57975 RepID=UPI0028773CA5
MMSDARLPTELAARTVEVMSVDVNVIDAHGVILESSDAARVGEIHAGAQLSLARARAVEIDDAMAANLSGARPGTNLPLSVPGRACGVTRLPRHPDAVLGLGQLAGDTAAPRLKGYQLTADLLCTPPLAEALVHHLLTCPAPSPRP